MAVAGCVSSKESERNNRWCSVTMPSSVVPSEVIGAASGARLWNPSGGEPHPPLESEITTVVGPHHLVDHAKTTPFHLAYTGGSTQAAPSCRYWEVTVIKHAWALPGVFFSDSSRAGMFLGE